MDEARLQLVALFFRSCSTSGTLVIPRQESFYPPEDRFNRSISSCSVRYCLMVSAPDKRRCSHSTRSLLLSSTAWERFLSFLLRRESRAAAGPSPTRKRLILFPFDLDRHLVPAPAFCHLALSFSHFSFKFRAIAENP